MTMSIDEQLALVALKRRAALDNLHIQRVIKVSEREFSADVEGERYGATCLRVVRDEHGRWRTRMVKGAPLYITRSQVKAAA